MFKYRFSLLALIMASTAVSAQPWEEKFFNPKKLDGDIVLPMPCEGSMVFRVIKTNTKKPLEDIKVTLGGNSNDEDGYAQYATPNYISGSFANEKQERYFLMGKYEVTEAQFNAVMKGEQCPSVNMKTSLPAINMSWFDAVEFTHKYNEWLLKNAADKLPTEDGSKGFVRLPFLCQMVLLAMHGHLKMLMVVCKLSVYLSRIHLVYLIHWGMFLKWYLTVFVLIS